MKRKSIRNSGCLISGLLMLGVCAPAAQAQASLKAIDAPQGGKIVYGKVDGAHSQADVLVSMLRSVHRSSGEKPLIGRAFRLRYTDSVALFYAVVDRSQDNKPVAGLLIAAAAGPKQVEAALVSDDASRFGKTVNPMLQLLSDSWHPSGLKADADPTWCGHTSREYTRSRAVETHTDSGQAAAKRWTDELAFAPQNNGGTNQPLALHFVTTPDGTASVNIPEGWKLSPNSGSGTLVVIGPNGEAAGFNMVRQAIDPEGPQGTLQTNDAGKKTSDNIVYPANADIVKAVPDLFEQWRRLNGLDPTEFVIDRAEKLPTPQGDRCVHVTGQVNPDGKGMQSMNSVLCATEALRGKYLVLLFHTLLPLAVADRERATMSAMLASFRVDTPLSQRPDVTPPGFEASRLFAKENLGLYGVIEQEFNSARAVIAAQGCHPSDPWGLNAYLLNPSALGDNYKDSHSTAWNSAADALVNADPNRFEYVETPNYLKGVDY